MKRLQRLVIHPEIVHQMQDAVGLDLLEKDGTSGNFADLLGNLRLMFRNILQRKSRQFRQLSGDLPGSCCTLRR